MFYTDNKLHFPVRVERPDPLFARALLAIVYSASAFINVFAGSASITASISS